LLLGGHPAETTIMTMTDPRNISGIALKGDEFVARGDYK
jgi:hypothetical protein